MSRKTNWLWVNAAVLIAGLAVHGCGSDSSGLDDPDAGDPSSEGGAMGSGMGPGGSVGVGDANGEPSQGGNGQVGGAGGAVVGQGGSGQVGGNGQAGAGQAGAGQGGAAAGGRGGMNNGGAPATMCTVGATCSANQVCSAPCTSQGQPGTRSCACVGAGYFCGACERGDAGLPMDPGACPTNPQGKSCNQGTQFCSLGSGQQASGCACLSEKFFCPSLAAPEGSAACPAMPSGKTCNEQGTVCAASATTSCACVRLGGQGSPRTWVCGLRN